MSKMDIKDHERLSEKSNERMETGQREIKSMIREREDVDIREKVETEVHRADMRKQLHDIDIKLAVLSINNPARNLQEIQKLDKE